MGSSQVVVSYQYHNSLCGNWTFDCVQAAEVYAIVKIHQWRSASMMKVGDCYGAIRELIPLLTIKSTHDTKYEEDFIRSQSKKHRAKTV